MKNFEVEYIKDGKRQKMFLKANDRISAQNMVRSQKSGVVVKIGETQTIPLDEQIAELATTISRMLGLSRKIKIPNLVASIRQLSVMANAGISIHDSIKEVANSTEDRRLKEIFSSISDDLNSGLSLTEAASKFKTELGDVVISMLSLGENTGNMGEALVKLSSIVQDMWDNQVKFKKAMRYPIVVIVAICVAFLILILFVVPQFKQIFEELGANLPLPTRILLGIEDALSNHGLIVLSVFLVIVFSIRYLNKNNDDFKKGWDAVKLKLYLIKKIIFFSTMARYTLVFTELVRSGIPIADALNTASKMIDNHTLKVKLGTVKLAVGQGVSLTEALRNTGVFENMLIQMISAGEQSGSLDAMLKNVSDYYKMKFDEIIDNISSYIEPLLLFVMACLVVLLALGIFMPMWDLGAAVKN